MSQIIPIDAVKPGLRVDVDDRTARLAALAMVEILRGLTDHPETE